LPHLPLLEHEGRPMSTRDVVVLAVAFVIAFGLYLLMGGAA
jgi:hypothetical protein